MDKLTKTILKMKKNHIPMDLNCSFMLLTTLGCGGKIYLTLFPTCMKQLIFAVKYLQRHKVPFCMLGHGSNVLASDLPYNGVVVVTTQVKDISVCGTSVTAACGTSTSKLCSVLVANGLSGGEFFGCLPATVGGAVVCNAGCFGQCAQQIVTEVVALFRGKIKHMSNKQCMFAKRNSVFKNSQYVVLQATMRFGKAPVEQIKTTLENMRQTKRKTQPLGCRSAGCVLYSNDVAVSKLIDQAGLKGYTIGGAQVSEKHAGFVINLDKATASDIYLIIEHLKDTLWQRYSVRCKTELCLVNFPTK